VNLVAQEGALAYNRDMALVDGPCTGRKPEFDD
jgi:hypothetical protein